MSHNLNDLNVALDSHSFINLRERLSRSEDHPNKNKTCMICGYEDPTIQNSVCLWCEARFPIKRQVKNS